MTNYERIMKNMTVEQLASYMVNCSTVNEGDYGYDGEDEYWIDNYVEVYSSCANDCEYYDYEDAEKDLIEWFNKESEV